MAKSKVKVPKKIAGVRMPNAVRKSGAVDAILHNPLGREILGEAIVAAAFAAAAALTRHRPSGKRIADAEETAAELVKQAVSAMPEPVQSAAHTLSRMIVDATQQVIPATTETKPKHDEQDQANDH
jgi:hypothetical protein